MFEDSTITNAGKALIDSWVSGDTLTFTSVVTGSQFTSVRFLAELTSLPDVKQTKPVAAKESTAQGEQLTIDIDVVGLDAGYQLRQIGIYAKSGSGAPVLFAVLEDVNGFYIPSEAEMPDFVFEFLALIVMSVDGNVELKVDPTQLVTMAAMQYYVQTYVVNRLPVTVSAVENGETLQEFSVPTEDIFAALRQGKRVVFSSDKNHTFSSYELDDQNIATAFFVGFGMPDDNSKIIKIYRFALYEDYQSAHVLTVEL